MSFEALGDCDLSPLDPQEAAEVALLTVVCVILQRKDQPAPSEFGHQLSCLAQSGLPKFNELKRVASLNATWRCTSSAALVASRSLHVQNLLVR